MVQHGLAGGTGAAGSGVQHLVLMGVTGSGKTTLARALDDRLGLPYAEADDLHPDANIQKMSLGIPLTDADRWPWLATVRDRLTTGARAGHGAVVTCSALRRAYRDLLREAEGRVRFVHLTAPPAVLAERLGRRAGHFVTASLLPSQLRTLEPLEPDEDGVTVPTDVPPGQVADRVVVALGLTGEDPLRL